MVKSELKAMMTLASTLFIPLIAQADESSIPDVPSYLPGEKIKMGDLSGGYSASAAYSCENPWKLFLTGDYIYWIWQQEIMDLGALINPTAFAALAVLNGNGTTLFQTPGYESGFQLGLGCTLRGMDDWNVYAEYTWYKNTDLMVTHATDTQIFALSPTYVLHLPVETGVLFADDLTTTARMTYNAVDLLLQRPFYFGRKLTATFITGLQSLWISQKFTAFGENLLFIGAGSFLLNRVDGSFNTYGLQKSWGLGPKFGLDSSWLLGYGIKIMGAASFSLLYTNYIKLDTSSTGVVSDIAQANLQMNQTYLAVKPVLEAALGLGWGSYFCDQNLHFDVSLSYDFKLFVSYNVLDTFVNGIGSPGDTSLRGVNARVRFDF